MIALFGTWTDRVITLACLTAIAIVLPGVANWMFFDAVWSAADAEACTPERGACWAVVEARFRLIFFGLYPYDEHWRSALACVVIVIVTAGLRRRLVGMAVGAVLEFLPRDRLNQLALGGQVVAVRHHLALCQRLAQAPGGADGHTAVGGLAEAAA